MSSVNSQYKVSKRNSNPFCCWRISATVNFATFPTSSPPQIAPICPSLNLNYLWSCCSVYPFFSCRHKLKFEKTRSLCTCSHILCTSINYNWQIPQGTLLLFKIYSRSGGLPYNKGGDVRREISIEPLKGTNLGVA